MVVGGGALVSQGGNMRGGNLGFLSDCLKRVLVFGGWGWFWGWWWWYLMC